MTAIARLEVETVRMRLRDPYTIAYESIDIATNLIVHVVLDRGAGGWGCAAPDEEVTGETVAGAERVLEEAGERLHGRDPFHLGMCLEAVDEVCQGHPAALAALDMALFDALARRADLPLHQLLGSYRDAIPTSVTIGIVDADETVRQARDWVAQGFVALKLKGGLDAELDAERVRRVREAVGPGVELRFDANQGYDVAQTLRFVDAVTDSNLELLEQPTPADDLVQLGEVTAGTALPVMADESLVGLRDAFRIARHDRADMINIKLMKAGGLQRARRIDAVARAAGLETMVGCMDESALGIAAGLHFALSSPNVAYADLDGHLGLENDPFADAVRLDAGYLRPTGLPGLGLDR